MPDHSSHWHPSYWMPFTANRHFRHHPRNVVAANGMYYINDKGDRILDATSGLWCVNAGHGRKRIRDAIFAAGKTLDYAPAFQMGHPGVFACAQRLASILPNNTNRLFFVNSGSEAVETALKIALAYHRILGKQSPSKDGILVGRVRDYHGVCFGGLSVGGMANNKDLFAPMLPNVDHIRDTHDPKRNAFSRGQPEHGADIADDFERVIAAHGPDAIAALIIEPMAGSTGVLVPPKGYLERLQTLCRKYAIPLIADEVITAFGRLGHVSACRRFSITPDIMTLAKGITNGAMPMGAVAVDRTIADTIGDRPLAPHAIELPHGYTYSGHPLACAAAMATLDIYEDENLFARARKMEKPWQEKIHSLADKPGVQDIRNIGLAAAIEIGSVGENGDDFGAIRAFDIYRRCFAKGLLVRSTHNVIAMSPPLIVSTGQIEQMVSILADVLDETAP